MSKLIDTFEGLPTRLSCKAAAALLQVTERTLFNWRGAGVGPPHMRIGRKRVMYDEAALQAWLEKSAAGGAVRCPSCGGWTSPSKNGSEGGQGHG